MVKTRLITVIATTLLVALHFSASAMEKPNFDDEKMAALFEHERIRNNIPAVSIVFIEGDTIVWQAAFGTIDAEGKIPATVHTPFRIGSVGKVLNAVAIMRASNWNKTLLTQPVAKFDSRFGLAGPNGSPITLHTLLSHTSGITREPPVGHYLAKDNNGLSATVESISKTCRVYPPGEKIKYSNSGVAVAGRLLETLTKSKYADAVNDVLFTPMGMTNSVIGIALDTPHAVQKNVDFEDIPASRFDIGIAPAGDMSSSAADMGAFVAHIFRALDNNNDLLDGNVLEYMMRPFQDPESEDWHMEVGLGFILNGKFEKTKMARHGGGIYGFSTEFALLPEERLGVVVMSAREGTLGVTQSLGHHLLRVRLAERRGEIPPEFEPAGELYSAEEAIQTIRNTPLDEIPADWWPLLGIYGWEHGWVEILSDGKRLFSSQGDAPKPLELEEGLTFQLGRFHDYGNEWLRFIEVDGEVSGLAIGAGQGFTLPKIDAKSAIPPTAPMPCPQN